MGGFGLHTRSTSTIRQPLPATSPVPENMLVVQDQHSILQFPETAAVYEYDPGFYTEFVHSSARSPRPDGQFREAQFTVPHHGCRVGADPEGAGRPAEEDQLPQRGGEQQPDGDEARPAGDRAEDDRERDPRPAERDLPEPDVSTRRHQG